MMGNAAVDLPDAPISVDGQLHPQTKLRPPSLVMRLARMGVSFPTRLSFLRSLLRDMAEQKATIERGEYEWDAQGYGHSTYRIHLDGRDLTLIAWTAPLDAVHRTDRVIATAWDACFALYDGNPDAATISRLGENAKTQEAGRYDEKVLVLSRANKSVRLFDHVAQSLAEGRQPDGDKLAQTGYLMRTTAVYGNGKFGMADRALPCRPFRLEMLTVYMIREFTIDLVEHVAKARNGAAIGLAPGLRKMLGIGNSTGLGMAPFLVSHPILLNNWVLVRETAIARVLAIKTTGKHAAFQSLCDRATKHLAQWNVDDEVEQARIVDLRKDWAAFDKSLPEANPWNALVKRSWTHCESLQELVIALILELHGELIDGLTDCMGATHDGRIDACQTIGALKALLLRSYDWALQMDLSNPHHNAKAWYVSEEKLEPRLGAASSVPNEHQRMPHDIPARIQALAAVLADEDPQQSVAEFLSRNTQYRDIVKRVQTIGAHPYGEIQDNLIAEDVRPIDLLRCKLAFFGAGKFDPRSDLWTRIVLFQGAPAAKDLTPETAADVFMPAFELSPVKPAG